MLTIINKRNTFILFGVSKLIDEHKSYGEQIIELLDQVWAKIGSRQLSHTGINYVVYDADHMIFAGVELVSPDEADSVFEKRELRFDKYAYWKHIGPYSQLGDAHSCIQSAIEALGEQHTSPTLEIYGHWNDDPSKLETEILYNLS